MADFEIDERVDITDVVCPMTFVKAKVAMEEIEVGQVLAVTRMRVSRFRMFQEALRKRDSRFLNLLTMKMEHMTLLLKRLKNKNKKWYVI